MLIASERRRIISNIRRTSLNLNFELVERAKQELGTSGTTDTIHRALDEVVRRAALVRLSKWRPFDDPPPDGYDNWNDWIEADEEDEVP